MRYVDGYVLPVSKKNLTKYRNIARKACKVWLDHGALQYCESSGDDLQPMCGIPFPKLLKLKPNETVVFAYVVYKSRAHRDKVNAAVMKDPRLNEMCDPNNMPFDVKRMACGGFKTLVDG